MSEFVPENTNHEASAADENARLLDLYGRYGLNWKLLTTLITNRSSGQIKSQGHPGVKKRMDLILGNTDNMMNFGSNIREQNNLMEISIGDILG
jgi:hypothetical protein